MTNSRRNCLPVIIWSSKYTCNIFHYKFRYQNLSLAHLSLLDLLILIE
ncbi:hypothetical Protein YC6258_05048 [Gynuella sunshinyii YC6258]|uniref:Uncharacterized protein n=1 Tax=Gynuella sunshinyii YC6258 TaxID=1445510 RepID=A0A0C5VUU8_9GAMM|nr:hypothetical Protein YC6258_05048 [Gynuella sunshinyii YC6258]